MEKLKTFDKVPDNIDELVRIQQPWIPIEDEYTHGFKAGVQAISTIIVDALFRNCPQEAQISILQLLSDKYADLYMQVAKDDCRQF